MRPFTLGFTILLIVFNLLVFCNCAARKKADKKLGDIQESEPFRPLRIAQIAPLFKSVPPKGYGGIERVVYFLTEELVRMGHNVTLFASDDSHSSAKLVASPPSTKNGNLQEESEMIYMLSYIKLLNRLDQFDILHFHNNYWKYLVTKPLEHCSFTTMHGDSSVYDMNNDLVPYVPMISISDEQRTHFDPFFNFVTTVYNGIPKDLLKLQKKNDGDYLAFLGRLVPYKGPDVAIEIAVKTGIQLKIAAKTTGLMFDEYWNKTIGPMVEKHSDVVKMIGEVNETQKEKFLGGALALVFPIDWAEPFGLVIIEAMATGTPVIARRRGSVPEIVEHGVTGFIYETLDEAIEYVKRVKELDRRRIRKEFEKRFTAEKMARDYVKVYQKQVQSNKRKGLTCGKFVQQSFMNM